MDDENTTGIPATNPSMAKDSCPSTSSITTVCSKPPAQQQQQHVLPLSSSTPAEVQLQHEHEQGSSLLAAIFNFTNCIVGAGAIGLGGAMAESGGLISVASIVTFAVLTKRSLDLVVCLSIETPGALGSYEDLGRVAFGAKGALVIAASKFLYSFGCMVAYACVVKDNLAPAILHLLQYARHCYPSHSDAARSAGGAWWEPTICPILENKAAATWITCVGVILPLCLLRDMRALASLSALSIAAVCAIIGIIWYLYLDNPDNSIRQGNTTTTIYEDWLELRPGFVECLGTFVFSFVSQHTVHLAFHSLKPHLQTAHYWSWVSFFSVFSSCVLSLAIGIGVYLSFGQRAESNIFHIYPQTPLIDLAKLLLSITMVLTFPLPFLTCRELLILHFFPAYRLPAEEEDGATSNFDSPQHQQEHDVENIHALTQNLQDEEPMAAETEFSELEEPLLRRANSSSVASDLASTSLQLTQAALNWALLPDDHKQLKWPLHVTITLKLWFVAVGLAVAAPSLGDVLDLVGCATGTIIAFIVPSCLSFLLRGYSMEAALLLLVGSVVGTVGTYFSLMRILRDLELA